MKSSSSSENVSDSNDIDILKQKEIDKLKLDRSTRKLADTKVTIKGKNRQDSSDESTLSNLAARRVTLKDFNMVKLVGKGSFGKVLFI